MRTPSSTRSDTTLNGSVPDKSPVVLLLIDVINDFAFPEAPALLRHARPMARALRCLAGRARSAGVPVVYVNDNFGRWRSDFAKIVRRCTARATRGHDVTRLLVPQPSDYFVLKPKHSGFYGSSLEVLLAHLGARRLILTGLTTPQCVLFTAGDAYMRDYELIVPRDCVAAADQGHHLEALTFMKRFLAADIRLSTGLVLRRSEQGKAVAKNRALGRDSGLSVQPIAARR